MFIERMEFTTLGKYPVCRRGSLVSVVEGEVGRVELVEEEFDTR